MCVSGKPPEISAVLDPPLVRDFTQKTSIKLITRVAVLLFVIEGASLLGNSIHAYSSAPFFMTE
jgi:hypothetical protein